MRVPMSWLREVVELPAAVTAREVAERLLRAGLEVETVDHVGADLQGPVVVGRVLSFEPETHSNGKTIRWCRVDVGGELNDPQSDSQPAGRSVVCGADNFAVDDLVVVTLPGAVLPGGFAISARKTYGHVSDGMICSARELAMGEDAEGIIVLPPGFGKPGDDAVELLGLREDVLDIAVTPDRGYALSVRGVARETATAFDVGWRDPADLEVVTGSGDGWPVELGDPVGCDRFVARSVTGFDPSAPSPLWLQRRLSLAGMRPISLAVDVTNYVMLELGQPLHAYDRTLLTGPIVVRRAGTGESLETLDGTTRTLEPDDLLITDDTGPIGVAGVMGGAATEIREGTTEILIEAAHFDPSTIARAARRHRLPSEASRRFERGVDDRLQEVAAERAVRLLAELGAAAVDPGGTVVDATGPPPVIAFDLDLPSRHVGHTYPAAEVVGWLEAVGCTVSGTGAAAQVVPPSWRPDLRQPVDLVEEVARLHGYDAIPATLPPAPPGRGLTEAQRLRRRVGMLLASVGFVEVHAYPFVSPQVHDLLGLSAEDPRRQAVRLANPLSEEEPELRTSLLPGLLATLRRNVGRGFGDIALFESGLVFRPGPGGVGRAPQPGAEQRPDDATVAALTAAVPAQPRRLALVRAGEAEHAGWWGAGRPVAWPDAVEAVRRVATALGVNVTVSADEHPPWHPGRCARLSVAGTLVGHAGELHPRVMEAMGLPERTVAAEIDLDALIALAPEVVPAPEVSPFPVAKEDVAVVVPGDVPAAVVEQALRDGAGRLLEAIRLFDVYTGEQVGPDRRSLAFSLRLRAPDRTLTVDEVNAVRDAAVAEAWRRCGATLRT